MFLTRIVLVFYIILISLNCSANVVYQEPIDTIVVEKQKRVMKVFHDDKLLKTYPIALGFSPAGHKKQEGDGKTPEGIYYIEGKNPQSRFHLSLKLSYPSKTDWQQAKSKGVHPGNNIMIHGVGPEFRSLNKAPKMHDWTLGCIAVKDKDIEEIFSSAQVGTKVVIKP